MNANDGASIRHKLYDYIRVADDKKLHAIYIGAKLKVFVQETSSTKIQTYTLPLSEICCREKWN